MSENQVDRVATPISPQDLADALATAWPSVVGGDAPADAILVLMAQSAFETDRWKACWNWNFGNVKHYAGDGNDYFVMRCNEVINGQNVWIPNCPFRAYDSVDDGAVAYLTLLYKRFNKAWPFVLDGDPEGFVAAIRAQRYFTGSLTDYTNGVLRYFRQFGGIVPAKIVRAGQLWALASTAAMVGAASFYAWHVWTVDYDRRRLF